MTNFLKNPLEYGLLRRRNLDTFYPRWQKLVLFGHYWRKKLANHLQAYNLHNNIFSLLLKKRLFYL